MKTTNTTSITIDIDSYIINLINQDNEIASKLLKVALIKWPFMLKPLMKAAHIEGKSLIWRSLLTHSHFADVDIKMSKSNIYHHIAEIYAIRNGSLWNREEVHLWMSKTCESLLSDFENNISTSSSSFSSPSLSSSSIVTLNEYCNKIVYSNINIYNNKEELIIYKTALIEDFQENYPRLPAEANPLDPQFADPRLLDRRNFLQQPLHRFPRGGGRGGGGDPNGPNNNNNVMDFLEQAGLGGNGNMNQQIQRLIELGIDIPPEMIMELQNAQLQGGVGQNNQPGGGVGRGFGGRRQPPPGNIDYNAPLLQLFWQTLLPFYHM